MHEFGIYENSKVENLIHSECGYHWNFFFISPQQFSTVRHENAITSKWQSAFKVFFYTAQTSLAQISRLSLLGSLFIGQAGTVTVSRQRHTCTDSTNCWQKHPESGWWWECLCCLSASISITGFLLIRMTAHNLMLSDHGNHNHIHLLHRQTVCFFVWIMCKCFKTV